MDIKQLKTKLAQEIIDAALNPAYEELDNEQFTKAITAGVVGVMMSTTLSFPHFLRKTLLSQIIEHTKGELDATLNRILEDKDLVDG